VNLMTFGAALRKGNGNGVNLVVICGHSPSVQNRPGLPFKFSQVHHPFLTDFRTDCIQSVFSKNSTDNSLLNPSKKL